jgi:hypothetical protein
LIQFTKLEGGQDRALMDTLYDWGNIVIHTRIMIGKVDQISPNSGALIFNEKRHSFGCSQGKTIEIWEHFQR